VYAYEKERGGMRATTILGAPKSRDLDINVAISYEGLGKSHDSFTLPATEGMKLILQAKSQGMGWHYGLSRFASKLGWPNHSTNYWMQERTSDEACLSAFLLHRTQDLLGALSLLCGNGLFVGNVTSVASGHFADLNVVKSAHAHGLRPVP
jgi:hypothetical protein